MEIGILGNLLTYHHSLPACPILIHFACSFPGPACPTLQTSSLLLSHTHPLALHLGLLFLAKRITLHRLSVKC